MFHIIAVLWFTYSSPDGGYSDDFHSFVRTKTLVSVFIQIFVSMPVSLIRISLEFLVSSWSQCLFILGDRRRKCFS